MNLSVPSKLFYVFCAIALLFCPSVGPAWAGQNGTLTPKSLAAALAMHPTGAAATDLAGQIRDWFGAGALTKGPAAKIQGLTVAWAIEAPGASSAPYVISRDTPFYRTLQRIPGTEVYAYATTLENGARQDYTYSIDGKSMGGGHFEIYSVDPDSIVKPGVPQGKVTQMPKWHSHVFEGTERNWWVYVPAQYKPESPACVMIYQDGGGYVRNVPTVFDNLIAKGEMPVTVGIFIDPGTFTANGQSDRSFEYDTLSDQYARFLLEEILPEVEKTTKLRHDPASRALAGLSSGGICSFTAAWERPEQFSKVLSWIGSFTNIASGKTVREGGHNYEALIRKTPPKPIRVFLQDGDHDLDNANGNWPLANQQMAKSLAFAHYDYKFAFGHGSHSPSHGYSILPESLRWLWRGYKAE